MNPDAFELLGFHRSPWVAPAEVRARFTSLAAACHPDGPTPDPERFASLNHAARTLSDPRLRLAHLIAITLPGAPAKVTPIPEAYSTLFIGAAGICKAADQFAERVARCSSALEKALMADECIALQEQLVETQNRILQAAAAAHEQCLALHPAWVEDRGDPALLIPLRDLLTYAAKWNGELARRMDSINP